MNKQISIDITHPVLRDHRVHGQHMLPGLAYLDLLYQMFRSQGHSCTGLELRNLSIYHPLVVPPGGQVALDIQCTEGVDGAWQIVVQGQKHHDTPAIRYASAAMHRVEAAPFDETIDFDAIKRSARRSIDFDTLYAGYRRAELVHGEFMRAQGKLYVTDDALYADCSLGAAALPGASAVLFHPVLLDASAACAGAAILGADTEVDAAPRLFLPLCYESFRASALLQTGCIARIPTAFIERKNELCHLTLEFFDATTGNKVAQLTNFAGKLVRDPAALDPARKTASVLPASSAGVDQAAPDMAALPPIESFLRRLLGERLQTPWERIDPHAGYYEMGLNSLGLLEVVEAINRRIGTALPPTLLFEYSNVAELAAYLAQHHGACFDGPDAAIPVAEQPVPSEAAGPATHPAARTTDRQPRPSTPPARQEDIAIIGMAGRFPGARDIDALWDNLKAGKDCITEIPPSRWDWRQFEGLRSLSGKEVCRWGGFLDEPDCFDPHLLRALPYKTELIDHPEGRLFLEIVLALLENAGYTRDTLLRRTEGKVGMYVGAMSSEFPISSIANGASYFLNLNGPSIAIDTMSSSAMAALHMACEGLIKGDCRMAVVGGINLLHQQKYARMGQLRLMGSHANSRSFGDGDGFLPAEGAGAVLLKPLSQAIEDGNAILAVIKSTAISFSGGANGFGVPNQKIQTQLVEDSLIRSGVDPRTISYVEADANGSALGDAVEIAALAKAFGKFVSDEHFCAIGSVQSNIGHAIAATGMSQLIKVILQLQYRQLLPSIKTHPLNSNLHLDKTPFHLQWDLAKWERPVMKVDAEDKEFPRRAMINTFGAGGLYVNVITEEYLPHPEGKKASIVQADSRHQSVANHIATVNAC